MYKYNDLRLNDILESSETYTFRKENKSTPKDPKDLMVRAFLLTNEKLKEMRKTPNQNVIFNNNKEVKLETGKYITSNGKTINQETFNKVYKVSSTYIKEFLAIRQSSTSNLLDIVERLHGNKTNSPQKKRKI